MSGERADETTYDPVARGLHWLNAVLALITFMLAWCLVEAPRHSDARPWLIMLHSSCGLVILAVMVFWAGWRLRHRSPALRPLLTWFEVLLARATQAGIFLLFVAMPVSGYASLAAAGRTVSFFGLVDIPPLMDGGGRVSQVAVALHLLGQFLIYGLVALHVAAALLHGFFRRDGILERMLPRRL
jgi:cytochrome b561